MSDPFEAMEVIAEAADDLRDVTADLAELARLEDAYANPPAARIVDEGLWVRRNREARTAIHERWGIRRPVV